MGEQFRSLSERVNRLKQPMYVANAIIPEIFFSLPSLSLSLSLSLLLFFFTTTGRGFHRRKKKKKKKKVGDSVTTVATVIGKFDHEREREERGLRGRQRGACETAGGKFSLPVTRITRINFHGSVFGHGRRSSDINNFHSELALARVASFQLSDWKMRYAAEMRRTISTIRTLDGVGARAIGATRITSAGETFEASVRLIDFDFEAISIPMLPRASPTIDLVNEISSRNFASRFSFFLFSSVVL